MKCSAYRPHDRIQLDTADFGPSRTRQEFAAECDVNALMKRYEKTGVLPMYGVERKAQYLDLSAVPDFLTAMQMLVDAEHAFMRLPAGVRREFENDATAFVDFAQRPENIGKMREWGLAPPAEVADEAADAKPPVVPAAPSIAAAVVPHSPV